jgi:hypothetical protein
MRIWDFSRSAFGICAAAAMLAGCGGSQPPIGAPGAMPQSPAIAAHAEGGKSWIAPGTEGEDLLYVSEPDPGYVAIYDLQTGQMVGQRQQDLPEGACADKEGDVFVPSGGAQIVVYGHDGSVKRILTAPYYGSLSCSVDPTTGNLAATTDYGVSIYQQARGYPKTYSNTNFDLYDYCGYDDQGNLFVDGINAIEDFVLGELPKGGTSIVNLTLNKTMGQPGQVQWDGKYLAIAQAFSNEINRFSITGSSALFEGDTVLGGGISINDWRLADFWIQRSLLVASVGRNLNGHIYNQVRYYHYPAGGKPTRKLRHFPYGAYGVAVSPARH